MKARLTALFLSLIVAYAAAAADGVTLHFDFYYGSTHAANTTETLHYDNNKKNYEIQSIAKAIGLAKILYGDVISSSAGKIVPDVGLQMTAYHEKRGRREPQAVTYQNGILSLQRGDEQRQEKTPPPVFDPLSAAYRSYVLGYPVTGTLAVTNGWRLRDYVYEQGAEESVQTGLGELKAIPLIRKSPRGMRKIWLSPAYGYLPVRVYIDDKGHIFELIVKAITPTPLPASPSE